jgi:hypothetical protein
MPNGKVGDHPYTDIVTHGCEVYSAKADGLVRAIAHLADERTRRQLQDRLMSEFDTWSNPDVAKLERVLTELHDQLKLEARDRGFEV